MEHFDLLLLTFPLPPSSLPISVVPVENGRKKFKVVYVVLESQYQSTLTAACSRINENQENVCVECVGYLLEELRNPETLEEMRKDVADADIFIGSLIFIQELAEKVREAFLPPSGR
jgi:magnesium chelatase subunit H